MYGDSVDALSHIAVGTGGAVPQATDTTLQTETVRKAFGAQSKGADGIALYQITLTTAEGNGTTITEVGILNAASVGDLLNRILHTGIEKTSAFELKYEIEITVRRPT